ncbi:RDD family protein [Halomicrobium salinisoli]|uniref:RDD family protein n=1 Tax=Halomicrobium salinisoli TaxID=2878391 RepID=UPI001CF02B6A|nr:RDD family protein [Halomicrobium salinisoli]
MSVNATADVTQKAGLGRRAVALIVDSILAGLIVGLITGAVMFALPLGPDGMSGLILVMQGVGALLWFGYFIVLEALYGQTLGKMLLSIAVVSEDGSPIGWGESIIRNLLRIVDALPFLYLVGIVAIVLTDEEQRVGDLAASTLVVES